MKILGKLLSLLAPALLAFILGCHGSEQKRLPPAPAFTVLPSSAVLLPGQTLQFRALKDASPDPEVTWSIRESGGGTISTSGLYTAPAQGGPFHIKATLKADPQSTVEAVVTLGTGTSLSVVLDRRELVMGTGQSETLHASLINDPGQQGVTWSVDESNGGTISSTGTYTAPGTPGTYHARATSRQDPSKYDSCSIQVLNALTVANGVDLLPEKEQPDCFRLIPLSMDRDIYADPGIILPMQIIIPEGTQGRGVGFEFEMDDQALSIAPNETYLSFWSSSDIWPNGSAYGATAILGTRTRQGLLPYGIYLSGDKDFTHTDPITNGTTLVRELDLSTVTSGMTLFIGIKLERAFTVGQRIPFRLKRVAVLAGDGTTRPCTNIQEQSIRAIVK